MPTNQTQKQFDFPQFLQQFITETINLAGFGDLPEEFKQKYRDKLEIAVHKKIGTSLNNMLSDQDVEELGKLLKANSNLANEELFNFYNSKISNLPQKVADIMREFQQNFVTTSLKVQGGVGIL